MKIDSESDVSKVSQILSSFPSTICRTLDLDIKTQRLIIELSTEQNSRNVDKIGCVVSAETVKQAIESVGIRAVIIGYGGHRQHGIPLGEDPEQGAGVGIDLHAAVIILEPLGHERPSMPPPNGSACPMCCCGAPRGATGVRGVVRLVAIDDDRRLLIDGAIDGLQPLENYFLAIHRSGDISDPPQTYGVILGLPTVCNYKFGENK